MEIRNFFNDKRLWFVTLAIFILLIAVFDQNNLLYRFQLKQQIRKLEEQKSYYQQKIAEDSTLIERLKNDAFLEQYARENYLMKKGGEEVYVIAK